MSSSTNPESVEHSAIPGFIYSLIIAFPSWAGVVALGYALLLSGVKPLAVLRNFSR